MNIAVIGSWKKEDEANGELTDKENFQRHVENWGKKQHEKVITYLLPLMADTPQIFPQQMVLQKKLKT